MPENLFTGWVAAGYDAGARAMFEPAVLEPTVAFLAEAAAGGAALEFGIGTGRVALPLAARGITVAGIDLSADMIERLRAKGGAETIRAMVGDFATTTVPGAFRLVYIYIDGERVRRFDTPYRYAWPAELDLMARIAGLELAERWADWDRSPFTGESRKHVSVWLRPR